jgi:hypothetical protein
MDLQLFITTVQNSRILSLEQKEALLDNPDALPADYRNTILSTLLTFDQNSKEREALLREQLKEGYIAFERKLIDEGVEETKKQELLAKAKKQMDAFFPKA